MCTQIPLPPSVAKNNGLDLTLCNVPEEMVHMNRLCEAVSRACCPGWYSIRAQLPSRLKHAPRRNLIFNPLSFHCKQGVVDAGGLSALDLALENDAMRAAALLRAMNS